MVNSRAKKKAKTSPNSESQPAAPPDMSALHAPTAKGWSKNEWAKWSDDLDVQWKRLCCDPSFDHKTFFDKRNEAVKWAAPEDITVKISILVNEEEAATASSSFSPKAKSLDITISKHGNDTFRSIIDQYCKENSIDDRDNYHWSHKNKNPGVAVHLLHRTDVEAFFDLWHCHPPTLISRFINENTFQPEIVGFRKKSPPPKPSVAPSFEGLKSPPPNGNASSDEWDKWHSKNSGGDINFWMKRSTAIQYSCPDKVDIVLKGLSHEHTVNIGADEPLSVALSSYCASTNETGFAVTPSEVILRTYGDDPTFVDAQERSARMRFNGYLPLKLEVVYRDTSRTEAELETIRGPTPAGYTQFLGSGYRLSDTEQPWLVNQGHGIDCYNKIGKKALMIYKGTEYEPGYDPVKSWFDMTTKVKSILGGIVRKPRGDWSADSAAQALDGLTAALINLTYNDDWSRDALGKIVFANPKCRKEGVAVLRKMDSCAVSVINAANEFTTTSETATGGFGLDRALGQLKRLMNKYKDQYSGFVENDYDYPGYEPFCKALPLIED